MRSLLILIMFSLLFIDCKKEIVNRSNELNDEFVKNKIFYKYQNSNEVKIIEEKIYYDNHKLLFKLISKIKSENKTNQFYLEEYIVNETTNKATKQLILLNNENDTLKIYNKETLSAFVEIDKIQYQNIEYKIFKLIEKDWDMHSCKVSILSPRFGFLFSKSWLGNYESYPLSELPVKKGLIELLKENKKLSSCTE